MATDIEQFAKNLDDSQLMSLAEVRSFQDSLPPENRPQDAEQLARELVQARKLTRFQAAAVYQGKTKGLVFGEYVVLDRIGVGGMGEVFKARHRTMERVVALKVLPPKAVKSADSVKRFQREVRAAAKLMHPNIVTAYDAGHQANTHFLVMEYVDGRDLGEITQDQGPLPVKRAVDVVLQTARGLQYAHDQGVVHRDIKPGNLLQHRDGTVKILDMGLARTDEGFGAKDAGDGLTSSGQIMGTVDYMSPEQAEDTHGADHRSDIYSLGCTLYRLLTGEVLFDDDSLMKKLLAHREKPIPPLRDRRSDVSERLDSIYQRMVAKRPEDRYQSMTELTADLQSYEDAEALPPLRPPPAPAVMEPPLGSPHAKPPAPKPPPAAAAEESSTADHLESFFETLPPSESGIHRGPGYVADETPPPPPAPAEVSSTGDHLESFLESLPLSESGIHRGPGYAADETVRPRGEQDTSRHARKRAVLAAKRRRKQTMGWLLAAGGLAMGLLLIVGLAIGLAMRDTPQGDEETETAKTSQGEKDGEGITPLDPTPFDPPGGPKDKDPPEPDPPPPDPDQPDPDPVDPPPPEEDRRLPVPEAAVQQTVTERLNVAHQFDAARTATEKVELARTLIDLGGQPNDNADERFVFLRKAMELASDGGDEELMLQAVDAIGEDFDIDVAQVKQNVLDKLARARAEADQRRRQLDTRYAEATQPIEAMVAQWKFRDAELALLQLRFDEKELAQRLAVRRDEVKRLAELKQRIIDKVNDASPPLKKMKLKMRGINGDVIRANEEGLTAKTITDKTEMHAWSELGPKPVEQFLLLTTGETADHALAAGLLSLVCGDAATAERFLEQARSRGAKIEPYLAPLAQAAFASAAELVEKKEFDQAQAALAALEEKYGDIPWYEANKSAIDAAHRQIRSGIPEAEAERLYAQAAEHFKKREFFDVKPLVEKLKADFADAKAVTDEDRDPTFAEMELAVADLGEKIVVRKDGEGDYETIQEAIDAATANSLIEIQDNGPYNERVSIDIDGITLRGAKDVWPVVTSVGPTTNFPVLVNVSKPDVTIERLVLLHGGAAGAAKIGLLAASKRGKLTVRSTIAFGQGHEGAGLYREAELERCVFIGGVRCFDSEFRDCISFRNFAAEACEFENVLCCVPKHRSDFSKRCRLQSCTITGAVFLKGEPSTLTDCILASVESPMDDNQIEHCNVFGTTPFIDRAKPGKGCFRGDPQFANKKGYDLRLLPGSPCLKKASDGGDVGFHYTPELMEMLKLVMQLRQKGLVDF